MGDKKNMILTMQYEDGTNARRELLSIFKADNGLDYAALLPLNENDSVQVDASIELVRMKSYHNDDIGEDYLIETITTNAEFQIAKEAFEQLEFVQEDDAGEKEPDDLPTLSFLNGNGQMEDWKLIDVFDHNKRKYVALIPLSNDKDEDNINIHLMRIILTVQNGIEGCEVTSIPSDMEYEDVVSVFEQRVNSANAV